MSAETKTALPRRRALVEDGKVVTLFMEKKLYERSCREAFKKGVSYSSWMRDLVKRKLRREGK